MGAAKKRKEAFFKAHPLCCFCGGTTAATSIDHVPLRAAFSGRIGPDGFEFPACDECNHGTSDSEQIFALYVKICDRSGDNYDHVSSERLIAGVRNNYPELMPNIEVSANDKRRVFRHFGWERPAGIMLEDIPMVAVPKAVGEHIEINAVKLLAALHYKHTGRSLTNAVGVFGAWSQQGLPGVDEAQETLFAAMPQLVVGARVNTNIGDQFAYRWGQNSAESLFGYGAGFGGGLFVFAAAAPWEMVKDLEGWTRYGPLKSPRAIPRRPSIVSVSAPSAGGARS